MARRVFTPVQDATIYEAFPTRNAGLDEILEVGKNFNAAVRSLVKFNINSISESVDNPISANYYFNLRIANASDFQNNQSIEFYEISGSWDEGTGFFVQDLLNPQDGASWNSRNSSATWSLAGGDTGSLITTHTFIWKPDDLRLDITDKVKAWLTGSSHQGILLKVPLADENEQAVATNIKFFSRQTHTIYPPTIEAVWDTQTINVPANSGLNPAPEDFEIYFTNLKQEFISGSTQRIRMGIRPVNPIKTFSDTLRFGNKYYLPSGSYFGIKDAATNAWIIPFDEGAKISADGTGSYFDLTAENMFINRTYKIWLQIDKSWGKEIIDTKQTF